MKKYTKIETVFKRCIEPGPNKNRIIEGDWTLQEFETLAGLKWEATEKVDGTNTSVIWDGEKVRFAGRDENAQIPAVLVNMLIDVFTNDKFKQLGLSPMIVFGEGYGGSIQKAGKLYMPEGNVGFVIFDIWCGEVWLQRESIEDISAQLSLMPVPFVGSVTLIDAINLVKGGMRSNLNMEAPAEGLVLRAPHGMLTRLGGRIMTKIKTRDFAK